MAVAASGEVLTSVNPTSGERVIDFRAGTEEDVTRAVAAARAAAGSWETAAPLERARLLHRCAERLEAQTGELVDAVVQEVGKPLREAREEVLRAGAIIRYHAQAALDPAGATIPAPSGDAFVFTVRRPLGHVGLITPWNFPVAIPLWKLAPALAYGNTVVMKPAPHATAVALRLAEMFDHLPDGVFSLVPGGVTTGRTLARSSLAGLSFTGSTAAGLAVAQETVVSGARFQAEMGGKNASVVLADANLEDAADVITRAATEFAGQKCTATSRVIVERAVAKPLRDLLSKCLRARRIGDPSEESTDVGPLIDQAAVTRVEGFIERAVSEGAQVVAGGNPLRELGPCFFQPTMLTHVARDSELACTEVFGPVLALFEAAHAEEALELANDGPYGLAAAVFTRSLQHGLRFAHRLDAGIVRVNGATPGLAFNAPFGPIKASGVGWAEQGKAARDFFTYERTVSIADGR